MSALCTNRMYCDFILWTKEDMYIERVYPDESLWVECVKKAHIFFRTAILPEVIGKWFSRPPKRAESDAVSVQPQVVLTSTVTAEVQKVGK